jgi:hypothetical protein
MVSQNVAVGEIAYNNTCCNSYKQYYYDFFNLVKNIKPK